ncbi:hypothetical protein BGZ80_010356 [Entomortierella chlamydospora]|uniref:FAD-binding domain-containing protein n=1 Tax=Entomortierella chlamydospora TaxID=101097 RepID=A0A9P6T0F2_9FUNG|nr:hypothetical protein BGZ79_009398 [Entomortierella chlamydospora]KAG0014602.1 hypothetical protein BGZ80_010356 [Entomortierella chlamydospora]
MDPLNTAVSQDNKPKVLIIGAGIGGLMLGGLLEKANVPYVIYEKATEVKLIGSAVYFNSALAPIFRQIGIFDKLFSLGKPCNSIDTFEMDRQPSFSIDMGVSDEMGGAKGFVVSRAVLYDVLLEQVPAEKVIRGKKVLSTSQDENGVSIKCSDGTTAEGDILVGADGAYSAVRQTMYEKLKAEGKLSASDNVPLPYSCVCLVAQTDPMDPAALPELNSENCHFSTIHAKGRPYGWSTFTCANNVVCWGVTLQLDAESSKLNDTFKSSDWGPEGAQEMCNDVRDFPIVGGDGTLTLGDMIDNTPMDRISKVALEEKVFNKWYHGRTVLMGDACHKVHPASGRGAQLAIHDAITLANWISVLPASPSTAEAEKIFKEFKIERYPDARDTHDQGHMLSKILEKGFKGDTMRFLAKHMPAWLNRLVLVKISAMRPQVSFLPPVADNGTVKKAYQRSLEMTLPVHNARNPVAST